MASERTFYDEWLTVGDRLQDAYDRSPVIIHSSQVPWVRTRQDVRTKIILGDELGLPTMGTMLLESEIPPGWHTGQHSHGEEAIFILDGEGFSIVDGQRFDWHKETVLQIPYRAVHQHFNTGDPPARYLSAMALPLETYVKIARVEHIEDCGPNDPELVRSLPREQSQYLPSGRRVALHMEDAPEVNEAEQKTEAYQRQRSIPSKELATGRNGFHEPWSVSMHFIFADPPGYHSGMHAHLEAVLYVLDGEGYSTVRGVPQRWGPGDVLHVPPAMAEHQHFNESGTVERMLRVSYGIRWWWEDVWPEGYKVRRVYDKAGRPIEAGQIERVRERS